LDLKNNRSLHEDFSCFSDRRIRPMLPIKTKHGLKERNIVLSDSDEEEEDEVGSQVEKEEEQQQQEVDENSLAGTEVSIVELYAKRKERASGIST
jgi:hypothetical protein